MENKWIILLIAVHITFIGCMHKHGKHTKKTFTLLSKRNSPTSNNSTVSESVEKPSNGSSLNVTMDKGMNSEILNNKSTSNNESVPEEIKGNSENVNATTESTKNSTIPSPNENTNSTSSNFNSTDIEHDNPSNTTLEKISKFNSTKPFSVKKEDSKLSPTDNKNNTVNSTLSQTNNLILSGNNSIAANETLLNGLTNSSILPKISENSSLSINQTKENISLVNDTQGIKIANASISLIPAENGEGLKNSSTTNKTDTPIKDASEGQIVILKDSHSTNQLINNTSKAHINGPAIDNQIFENKQNISTLYHANKRNHGKKHGILKHHHGNAHHKIVTSKRSESSYSSVMGKKAFDKVKRATGSSKGDKRHAISGNIIDFEKEKSQRLIEEKKNASRDAQDDQYRNDQLHKLRKMKDHFDDFVNAIDKNEKENNLRAQIKDSESKLSEEQNIEASDNDVKNSVTTKENDGNGESDLKSTVSVKDSKDFRMLSTLNKLTDNSDDLSEKESQRKHYSSNLDEGKNSEREDSSKKENNHDEKMDTGMDKKEIATSDQSTVPKESAVQKNISNLALQHFAASTNVNEDDVTKRHSAVTRNNSNVIEEIKGIQSLPNENPNEQKQKNEKKSKKNSTQQKHEVSVKNSPSENGRYFSDHIFLNKTRAANEQLPNGPNLKIPKTFHHNTKSKHGIKTSKASNSTLIVEDSKSKQINSSLGLNNSSSSDSKTTAQNIDAKSSLPKNSNSSSIEIKNNENLKINKTKEEQTETVFSFNGPNKESTNNTQVVTKEINHKKLKAIKDFLKNQHKELNYRSVITHPAKILIRPIRSTGKKMKKKSGKISIV